MRVALYARVSTNDQTTENQLLEMRRVVTARAWTIVHEYVDHGVSGSKDRRPALDQLVADVRRHHVQGVVCWRLDRLGRNLRHLVLLLDECNREASHLSRSAMESTRAPRRGGWSRACSARLQSSSGRGCKSVFVQDSLGPRRKEDASVAGRRRPCGVWTPAPGCPTRRRRQGSASQSRASNAGAACRRRLGAEPLPSTIDALFRSSIGRGTATTRHQYDVTARAGGLALCCEHRGLTAIRSSAYY
jgi:Resolvase, N terminal domain